MKLFLILMMVVLTFFLVSCDEENKKLEKENCIENNLRCSSDKKQIEKCDANNEWKYDSDCTGLMLCVGSDNNLTCEEPSVCIENSSRCADDNKLEICDSTGKWNSQDCATDTECVEDDGVAKCETPMCDDNDNKCTDDKTGFITCPNDNMQTIEHCLDGKVCVGNGADTRCELPSTCVEGNTRCASDEQIETCDSAGNWISVDCATETKCVEDNAVAKCEFSETDCNDNNRCTDDNTGIITCPDTDTEVINDCLEGEVCSGTGAYTICKTPTDAPSIEEIQSASTMMNACGLDETISNLSEDIYMFVNIANIDDSSLLGKGLGILPLDIFQEIVEKTINCNKNSNTCTELATCLDVEITNETCIPGEFTNICEDNKAVICNWQGKVLKKTCEESTTCTIDLEDGDADCSIEELEGCNDETFVSSCNENIITTCEWGTEKTFDCGEERTCEMVNSVAKCMPHANLPNCNPDNYQSSCDNQYVLTCSEGKVIKSDCRTTAGPDYTCKENPSFLEAFLFAGCVYKQVATTCSDIPSCNGSTLKYCVNGQEETYNCIDNGYTACTTEAMEIEDGTNTADIGICTF